MWTGSSAAMGIAVRQGVGKVRHLDTKTLWIQQAVRTGRFQLRKVKGTENPADLFTKHRPTAGKLEQFVELFGAEFREGRPTAAPTMRRGRLTQETLGDAYNINDDGGGITNYPSALPHTGTGSGSSKDVIEAEDEEMAEQDEQRDELEIGGLKIADQLVEQSEKFGGRRKFNDQPALTSGLTPGPGRGAQPCVNQDTGEHLSSSTGTCARPSKCVEGDDMRDFMVNAVIKEQHRRLLQQGDRIRDLMQQVVSSRAAPARAPPPLPRP